MQTFQTSCTWSGCATACVQRRLREKQIVDNVLASEERKNKQLQKKKKKIRVGHEIRRKRSPNRRASAAVADGLSRRACEARAERVIYLLYPHDAPYAAMLITRLVDDVVCGTMRVYNNIIHGYCRVSTLSLHKENCAGALDTEHRTISKCYYVPYGVRLLLLLETKITCRLNVSKSVSWKISKRNTDRSNR